LNDTLITFETRTALGPTYAARLIGVAYITYAKYRSGARALPRYHAHHIQALLMLPAPSLQALIKEHANVQRTRQRST
jgi:hypothetical protein